jgi:hypothetical protein
MMAEIQSEWYSAVLEEYKSLRSEAVTARDAQLATLRVAIPLLAALIGLGSALRSQSFVGGLVLSVAVPLIVFLTSEMLIGEINRSLRAGAVVGAIERRLADLFDGYEPGPPMGWERWLRSQADDKPWGVRQRLSQQERDSLVRVLVISAFLLLVALGSYVVGLHFMWHDNCLTVMYITGSLMGAIFVAYGIRVYVGILAIRARHEIPPVSEIWPGAPDHHERLPS